MDLSAIKDAVNGKKTYIGLAIGAVAIALNHFGWWPNTIAPLNLDPNNWLAQEWTILVTAFGRDALAKVKTTP